MIPDTLRRSLLLAILVSMPLVGCGGSTTTTTVTRTAPGPASTTASSSATTTSVASATTAPLTSTATTPAPPAARVYFQGVAGPPAQRPGTLELTGDGTLFVSGVQWTSWGGPVATGTGNAEYHGCDPTCAQAPVSMALVTVRLSTIRACSGREYYSGATLILSSGQLLNEQFMQRSWSPC